MLNNVTTEDLLKLFNIIDYDKDGYLSYRDLIISLYKEVFNTQIDGFKDHRSRDDYVFDPPTRIQLRSLRDLFPLNDYNLSLMIHHGTQEQSAIFSLKNQLDEVIKFEETLTKWTMEERKSTIGQLEKKDKKAVYKVYYHAKQYKSYGMNIWG